MAYFRRSVNWLESMPCGRCGCSGNCPAAYTEREGELLAGLQATGRRSTGHARGTARRTRRTAPQRRHGDGRGEAPPPHQRRPHVQPGCRPPELTCAARQHRAHDDDCGAGRPARADGCRTEDLAQRSRRRAPQGAKTRAHRPHAPSSLPVCRSEDMPMVTIWRRVVGQ